MGKSKTILMIAPQPFLEPRGTPISVYHRVLGLTKLGHQVDLLTCHLGDSVDLPGLIIHRIPRLPWVKEVRIGASSTKLVLDAMLFWRALCMLATRDYDVVHSHEEASYLATPLALLFRKRHVYDMHSSLPRQLACLEGWNSWPMLALSRVLERWAIRSADAVIVVSEGLEQVARTICQDARIKTIENVPLGVGNTSENRQDIDGLRTRLQVEGRVPVVYTGTLEPYQGIDLLLDSAPAVIESCPAVVFLLVGGTDGQVKGWRRELKRRGLADHVRLEGCVPLEQVSAYLEIAEILVSPRKASMPVPSKIYSYMEAGKPIVATDVDSHTEVLTEEAAVLVKPTSEALSQALVRLIETPALRQELCDKVARLYQRNHGPELYLAGLREVYGRLVD